MKLINCTKRQYSAEKYLDSLFDNYSKLSVVRVDLAYKKPYSNSLKLDDAIKDINRLKNNRRGKPSVFENNVGYIIKSENTEAKGMHCHVIFFYDGNKVSKDTFKAKQIGEYWNSTITNDKGTYHNCNMNNYGKNGIGMIDYKDKEKIGILKDEVISYLCKDEQDISRVEGSKNYKSFIRGTILKTKSKVGRPRSF
ncbi:inovirus Gp2 family protein [Aliarcobacter butzleri]|uniref:inovirus Gp2 family protein n=1 Tax=Aliarcobacter butzleri TaxID=28197 RepID=UPI0021B3DC5E|nr:inovirus Gp2 family protein [Aliarcobacter butzleri]MCT7553643.1 inovirus Gp2 family protein [Aliarcobacter butzleri]